MNAFRNTRTFSTSLFNAGKSKKIARRTKFMCNPYRIQLVKITIYPEFRYLSGEYINRIMAKLLLNSFKNPSINFLYSWLRHFYYASSRKPSWTLFILFVLHLSILCDRVRRFCTFVKCVRPFLSMTLNQTSKMLNTTTLNKLQERETIVSQSTKIIPDLGKLLVSTRG